MGKKNSSNLVAAGIFLSRIAGLIREQVLAVAFGRSKVTDVFRFAMRIPNLLQNLLGEGSLSASFIPVYSKLLEEEKTQKADDLAKGVLAILTLMTTGIVVLLVVLARPLVWLFTPWENDLPAYNLATQLVQITSIGIGFLVVSAWCLGVLNSHRKFFLSYVAPVIWNVTQIAVIVTALVLSITPTSSIAVWVSWSVVLGGLFQLMIQLPAIRKLVSFNVRGRTNKQKLFTKTPELQQVLSRFLPAVSARGIIQLSSYADTFLAVALFSGALASYTFALPLYLLPISLFGFSVAAAELAEMSRLSDSNKRIAERLVPALRRVLIPAGFITAAYLAASRSFIDALYGWPSEILKNIVDTKFSQDDVLAVALVLTVFSLALPAIMTARVTQNTLYSLGEVRGPAKIAAVRLVVMFTCSFFLMFQLDWIFIENGSIETLRTLPNWNLVERVPDCIHLPDPDLCINTEQPYPKELQESIKQSSPPHLGILGLAFGGAIASWVEWALLRRMLANKLEQKISSGWARPVLIAAATAAVPMFLLSYLSRSLKIPSPIDAILIVVLGACTYAVMLRVQHIDIRKVFRS